MFYNILKHAHSGFRWIVLLLLVTAIANAFLKWRGKANVGGSDRKINLFAMVFTHLQFVFGLILYFISPKVIFAAESMKIRVNRFFLVEHLTIMLLAVVLVTVGYSLAKRAASGEIAFRRIFYLYLAGLLLILLGIPWPSQGYGTGWY